MIEPEETSQKTYDPPALKWGPGKYDATATPTATNDETEGFSIGSRWYKESFPYRLWECVSNGEGVAVWKEVALSVSTPAPISCLASENLAAPDLVHLHNASGTLKARKADATDNTRPADGFILVSANTGETATVYTAEGLVITGLSGLTVADVLYLSETAGAVTATPPTGSGKVVQQIGKALTTTTALFKPLGATTLP